MILEAVKRVMEAVRMAMEAVKMVMEAVRMVLEAVRMVLESVKKVLEAGEWDPPYQPTAAALCPERCQVAAANLRTATGLRRRQIVCLAGKRSQ